MSARSSNARLGRMHNSLVLTNGSKSPIVRKRPACVARTDPSGVEHSGKLGHPEPHPGGRLGRVNLSAQAAADLYELLRLRGIRCWVMGGWGVDALLGEQTRQHHDLDVLVLAEDLSALGELFADDAFGIKQVWEAENRWPEMRGSTWPTAFVAATERGLELDVHVITFEAGLVVPLCNVAWPFDADSLQGRGVIDGRPVECVSRRTQEAMHRGYALPEAHKADLDLLRRLP
jgi:lincosamide nucleotidyltransferase A/C/D/E